MTQVLDTNYEKKFMLDLIHSLKYLNRGLGHKLHYMGELVEKIAKELQCENEALYFAGYYANIGLMMLGDIINKPNSINNDKEMELIKQHVFYSAEFIEKRGFKKSAELIVKHHEKPLGGGYYSIPNKNKDVGILNIADEFVGLTSTNAFRQIPTVKHVAIAKVMESYTNTGLFSSDETKKIKDVLSHFYEKIQKQG